MRVCILSVLLLFSVKESFGQSVFTMPTKTEVPQETIIKYDSLHNIRFGSTDKIDYLKDFEQYIGQEIIFYDFGANLKDKAEGYINFEAEPTVVRCDTVWLKRKKKVKPEHYRVDTVHSRKYNPLYFEGGDIRSCSSIVSMSGWDKWKPFTGCATPVCDINSCKFTVVDFCSKNSGTYFHIILKDQGGNELSWIVSSLQMHLHISKWNRGVVCWPVIAKGFMDKMIQKYSNKEFFFIHNNKVFQSYYKSIVFNTLGEKCQLSAKVKYKFKDLVYVDLYGTYSVPCFLVEDSTENQIFIPLCRMPNCSNISQDSVYEPNRESNERWAYMEDLTFKLAEEVYEERRQEQQRIEDERRRKAMELAAMEQTQKEVLRQKAIEAANRKAALTKRYGAEIAELIVAEKVRIGMSDEMCRESWGAPSGINRSTGSWGVHEQWVYSGSNYLYFENGKLTSIQN